MKTACLIVIGHVDHGKTTLVRALTGIDTDRLTQEKERGLSITLGFAHCTLGNVALDLIDAPGHEDFTRAMVSGATGAQGALLVISAPDGIEAQTREHLCIARLLDVPIVAVALTKVDLVASDALPHRIEEVRTALSGAGFEQVPIFPCASNQQDGLSKLTAGLETLVSQLPPATGPQDAFLPIDRVFSLPGAGTIVTGTLLGGALCVEAAVTLHPKGRQARIRGLQSRGMDRAEVSIGERTAINLRGIATDDLTRGDVLAIGDSFAASDCLDIHLSLLPETPRPLTHMQELRAHFGTLAEPATLRLLGARQIAPGQSGFAQLRFRRPVTGFAGQRILLRGLSPVTTLGAAVILDPQARPAKAGDRKRRTLLDATLVQDAAAIADALCEAGRGAGHMTDLIRLSRTQKGDLPPDCLAIGEGLFSTKAQVNLAIQGVMARLETYHAAHPIRAFAPLAEIHDKMVHQQLSRRAEDILLSDGILKRSDDRVALVRHDPWALLDKDAHHHLAEVEAMLLKAGVRPPDLAALQPTELDADLLDLLVLRGTVILLRNVALRQTIPFHHDALDRAADRLRAAFSDPFTTSEARTVLDTSRKFIVPILEHFDSLGITQRIGDARVIAPQESRS